MNYLNLIVPVTEESELGLEKLSAMLPDTNIDVTLLISDLYSKRLDKFIDTNLYKNITTVVWNKDINGAIEQVIENSKCQYISIISNDDKFNLNDFRVVLSDIQESDADILVYGYNKIDKNDNIIGVEVFHERREYDKERILEEVLHNNILNNTWNKVYKKNVISGCKIYSDCYGFFTSFSVFTKCNKMSIYNRVIITHKDIFKDNNLSDKRFLHTRAYNRKCNMLELLDIVRKSHQEKMLYDYFCESCHTIGYLWRNKTNKSIIEVFQSNCTKFKEFLLTNKLTYVSNSGYMLKYLKSDLSYLGFSFSKFLIFIKKVLKKLHITRVKVKKENISKYIPNTEKNKLYLIGTPDHDNLGDYAILLSTKQFLQYLVPLYEIIEISEKSYWKLCDSLSKIITKEDIVILQGGGNLGDQYKYIEKIRRDAIKRFRNKIFMFPQTIYFENTKKGYHELKKTQKIYSNNKKLVLMARERISYQIMKEEFPSLEVFLLPDIVLRYRFDKELLNREGILLCLRSDFEGKLSYDDKKYITNICRDYTLDISLTDTSIRQTIKSESREDYLSNKLNQFSASSLVITDRLHGMVFAALTETPCIVLGNYNHKIFGVYQWIEDLNYIVYINSINELKTSIDHLWNLKQKDQYNYSNIDNQYTIVKERIN